MAHTKSGGSTALGRDSAGQRLGVKKFAGEFVEAGEGLVRQRGTTIKEGANVKRGADDTLYALISGRLKFSQKKIRRFDNGLVTKQFVSVQPDQ